VTSSNFTKTRRLESVVIRNKSGVFKKVSTLRFIWPRIDPMSVEHWQRFQKSQTCRFSDPSLPVDSVEYERRRRRQDGMCSVKGLFCCLSVLFGKNSAKSTTSKQKTRQSKHQLHLGYFRDFDDDSFGYNFDNNLSPRQSLD